MWGISSVVIWGCVLSHKAMLCQCCHMLCGTLMSPLLWACRVKLTPLIVRCGHARLLGNDDLMHSASRCGLVVVVLFVGGSALVADVCLVESDLLVDILWRARWWWHTMSSIFHELMLSVCGILKVNCPERRASLGFLLINYVAVWFSVLVFYKLNPVNSFLLQWITGVLYPLERDFGLKGLWYG